MSRKIMLIDDDEITNMINEMLIRKFYNFEVTAYTNASESLAHIKDWSTSLPEALPDLIFLDVNMPLMDGWEFLDEFQLLPLAIRERCNVVMLTSSIDLSDLEKSKTYPSVSEFISKPLTLEKLKLLEMV